MTNGNSARLLGNYDSDGVRLFGNSESGAVPQPETAIQCFPLAHGKNACRSCDPSVPNDHSAVMQCGFWMKDRQHQFDRKLAVDDDASFLINANRRVALDRDQCAELFVRQLRHRFCQIMDSFSSLARE